MLKKLLLVDISIQFVLILTALFLLIYFEETDRASLVFYLGLGGYQLITHFIKLYYLKLKNETRIGFYSVSLKVMLFITALLILIFLLSKHDIIEFNTYIAIFLILGGIMLLLGATLAITNIIISIDEAKGV